MLGDAKYSIIYEYGGQLQQATFDNTFDLTFYLRQNVDQRPLLRIDTEETADEGIYLRWVDRYGYIAHWLFKVGDEQRQIAAVREFSRNAYTNYDTHYGWQRGSGRRQSMSRNDIVPLCAPLATRAIRLLARCHLIAHRGDVGREGRERQRPMGGCGCAASNLHKES